MSDNEDFFLFFHSFPFLILRCRGLLRGHESDFSPCDPDIKDQFNLIFAKREPREVVAS